MAKKIGKWEPEPIEPAIPFAPHNFNTTVGVPIPTIYMTQKVVNDIFILVDQCDIEIGWLGIVEPYGEDALLIKEIFVPKQQCHAATTKLSPDGIVQVYTDLMKRDKGADLVNKLRFWGHSHVNMDVQPSHQDDDQMKDFGKNKCEYFIRGIFNKKGSAKFDIWYYEKGISLLDVPWAICPSVEQSRKDELKKVIKDKVKEEKYTPNYKGYRYKSAPGNPKHASGVWPREEYEGRIDLEDDRFDH